MIADSLGTMTITLRTSSDDTRRDCGTAEVFGVLSVNSKASSSQISYSRMEQPGAPLFRISAWMTDVTSLQVYSVWFSLDLREFALSCVMRGSRSLK